MSAPHYPLPGFIFCSVLYNRTCTNQQNLLDAFQMRFGPATCQQITSTTMQAYYQKELGAVEVLARVLLMSVETFPRSELVAAKIWSWQQEAQGTSENKRTQNWDPGLLNEEQLLLATGKPYAHRIYLGQGIYADLTLMAQKQQFVALPWSYPDYASAEMLEIFEQKRKLLIRQLRPLKNLAAPGIKKATQQAFSENHHR